MADEPAAAVEAQRIDQWLWFARIVKSRTLGQALIERGKVRLNRERITKSSQPVKPSDVVTISLAPKVRVLQIVGIGERRGPAPEASRLYLELTEPNADGATQSKGDSPSGLKTAPAVRPTGAGRPTKRDRRAIDRLKDWG